MSDREPEQPGAKTETDGVLADGTLVPDPEKSPVPGMDLLTFKNYLTRALGGDDAVPPAFLNLVNAGLRNSENNPRERDLHWWEEFFWRQTIEENLRAINELVNRYSELAAWHHEQAGKAREKMREAGDQLATIHEFISGVDELAAEKPGGKFDRGKAIQLLRTRGVEVDPEEDENLLLARLFKERERAKEDRLKWSNDYDAAKDDAERHDSMEREDRRKALELIEKREAIRGAGYDAQEESQRLQKLTDEYKLDVQHKAGELEGGLDATNQESFDASQSAQAGSQASEFMRAADDLVAKFAATTAKAPTGSPKPETMAKPRPGSGPGSPL